MSAKTAIEWTDSTWNPIRARRFELQDDGGGRERIGWHCEHASEGCRNCYAERMNAWVGTGRDYKPAHLVHVTTHGDVRGDVTVFLDEKLLTQPLRWTRGRRIFPCSMTDLFADFVSDEDLDRIFAVMALAPQHTYQVLTKRARRMREYFANRMREALIGRQVGLLELARSGSPVAEWSGLPMPHVQLGVSAEDQPTADERVVELLQTLAAVRFVSLEPMLGAIDLQRLAVPRDQDQLRRPWDLEGSKFNALQRHDDDRFHQAPAILDWVIAGGESGPHARPAHPDWFRGLRDQCADAGVPFLFKQWGEWTEASREPIHPEATRLPGNLCRIQTPGQPDRYSAVSYEGRTRYRIERVGKAAAGRLLDGVQHDGMPG